MPTFLPQDRWDTWLDPKLNNVEEIRSLLEFPNPTSNLSADPVSSAVNSIRNNGPQLIAPIELGEPTTLF